MANSEKNKMLAGALYQPNDPELQSDLAGAAAWMAEYNAPVSRSRADRHNLLVKRFAFAGDGAEIRPPFHCDYGFNIRIGSGSFMNFNCVILDIVEVSIGDNTQIGPAVQIYAADHPRDLETRRSGLEFGRPVRIGSHVWIGGGAIILPGVTIGDDAIVGAGAVVTRDVSPGATVYGNPARAAAR